MCEFFSNLTHTIGLKLENKQKYDGNQCIILLKKHHGQSTLLRTLGSFLLLSHLANGHTVIFAERVGHIDQCFGCPFDVYSSWPGGNQII